MGGLETVREDWRTYRRLANEWENWIVCGRIEECVGGLEKKWEDWRMCGMTEVCVGGLGDE